MINIRSTLLFLLIVATAVSVGSCRRADKNTQTAQPTPSKENAESPESSATPKVEIPAAAMTESLKYLGAPFQRPIKYKMTGSPAISEATQTIVVKSADDEKVVVAAKWDSPLLGSETYESKPDGVWCVELRGERLKEPVLFLPSDVTTGKRWTQDFVLTTNGESLRLVNRMRIVGVEKVTVPLGEFDALVIEQTSTITSANAKRSGSGKTWLAQGVGVVKSVVKHKGTRGAERVDSTIEVVAIQ